MRLIMIMYIYVCIRLYAYIYVDERRGKKNYFESPILIGRGATRVQWSACSESPCTCDLLPGRAMVVVNNQLQQKNYD